MACCYQPHKRGGEKTLGGKKPKKAKRDVTGNRGMKLKSGLPGAQPDAALTAVPT